MLFPGAKEVKYYPRYIISLARKLRQRSTPAEKLLWPYLRNHQLLGLHFRRQCPIEDTRFIADFYCHSKKLIIELEGGIHSTQNQKEYDEVRFAELEGLGYEILRLRNEEILNDVQGVLRRIERLVNLL